MKCPLSFRHCTGMLLVVIMLMTMSGRAVASRYAKVSKAWIEHNVTLAGHRGMMVHFNLTVGGMKRRQVNVEGEVTLDSDVAGKDPEVVSRYHSTFIPTNDVETHRDYTLFVNYNLTDWPTGDHHYHLNLLVSDASSGEDLNEPGSTILDFNVRHSADGSCLSYDEAVEDIKRKLGYPSSATSSSATAAPPTPSRKVPAASVSPSLSSALSPSSSQEMTADQKRFLAQVKDRTIKLLDAGDGNYIVIATSDYAHAKNKVTSIFWVPRDFTPYPSTCKGMKETEEKGYTTIYDGIDVTKLVNHTLDGREASTVYVREGYLLANGKVWDYNDKALKGQQGYFRMEEHRISSQAAAWLQLLIEGKLTTMSFQGRPCIEMETTDRLTLKAPRYIRCISEKEWWNGGSVEEY